MECSTATALSRIYPLVINNIEEAWICSMALELKFTQWCTFHRSFTNIPTLEPIQYKIFLQKKKKLNCVYGTTFELYLSVMNLVEMSKKN